MNWARWIVTAAALLESGWLLFDGLHALIMGDYVTPRTGRFTGQLGPWAKLWESLGIDPRSCGVQGVHVALGSAGIVCLVAFLLGKPWAWHGMLICAIASAWYLPFGTLLSIVQIVLLVTVLRC